VLPSTLSCGEALKEVSLLEVNLLEKLFLRHLFQLRCNSHAVSEVLDEADDDLGPSNAPPTGISVEMLREIAVGTVLLLTASLFNHSCSPNAIFRCSLETLTT